MKTKAEFRVTQITENHVQTIKQLLAANPSWSRRKLSMELCRFWSLYSPVGQANEGYGLPGSPVQARATGVDHFAS